MSEGKANRSCRNGDKVGSKTRGNWERSKVERGDPEILSRSWPKGRLGQMDLRHKMSEEGEATPRSRSGEESRSWPKGVQPKAEAGRRKSLLTEMLT